MTIRDKIEPRTAMGTGYFTCLNESQLRQALSRPQKILLEAAAKTSHYSVPVGEALFFQLVVCSETAYHYNLPLYIADKMVMEGYLKPSHMEGLRLCLQEAIINAVIHGNLELKRSFFNLQGFRGYYAAIERKLRQSEYGQKPIILSFLKAENSLKVVVSDAGSGVRLSNVKALEQADSLTGRGLPMIASIASRMGIYTDERSLEFEFYG